MCNINQTVSTGQMEMKQHFKFVQSTRLNRLNNKYYSKHQIHVCILSFVLGVVLIAKSAN